jgi:hypothetical protein
LAVVKEMLYLEIDMEALSNQLYKTFSPRTSIPLFTNSSDGDEKRNLPLTKKLPLGTLTKKVA